MNQRIYIHVDLDAFFVSVEELLDPTLVGKPVAVGGSPEGRGVITSASYAAREYGVRSGMPAAQALRLCPSLKLVRGGRRAYSEASRSVMEILKRYSPNVSMQSIDEACLDITGTERLQGHPVQQADRLLKEIREETGLPASAGVAASRMVAKVASDHGKPRGLVWVRPGSELAFLAPLPLRKIPGIGPRATEFFERRGCRSVADLIRAGATWPQSPLGNWARILEHRALGLTGRGSSHREGPKSVSHEVTFPRDIADRRILLDEVRTLAQKAGTRLRKQGGRARTVTLKLRFAGFETITRRRSLTEATDLDAILVDEAARLFRRALPAPRPIRLVGIGLGDIEFGGVQIELFPRPEEKRARALQAGIDRLRWKHGKGILGLGMQPQELRA